MKHTNFSSCGSRLVLLAFCWVVCFLFTGPASAIAPPNGVAPVVVPAGGFAIDGGLLANTPTNGVGDWIAMTNLFPGAGGGVLASNGTPLNAATTFHFLDPYSTSTDTIMLTGSPNTDPNAWTWGTGSINGKEDMNNGLVHIGRDASNHVWLIMSADHTGQGEAFMYFYFLQSTLTRNVNGTFTSAGPQAGFTTNDLRVQLDFIGSSFLVDQWQTNTSGGGYKWVDVSSLLPAGSVFLAVNSGNTYVPYGTFGSTNCPSEDFVEAAADFTALIGNINPCATAGFSNVFMVTLHPNGDMSDFIGPIPAVVTVGLAVNAGPDQTNCYSGATSAFAMNASVSVGVTPSLSTNWSVVSGPATILDPGSLTTGVLVTNIPAAGTNVTLRLTITSTCSNKTDDVVLTVMPQPPACSVSGATVVCPGTTNVYSAPAGWSAYAWGTTGNGGITGPVDQQTVTVVAGTTCNQNFTLNLFLTTNACFSSCSLVVPVNDTNPPSIACPGNLVLSADPGKCSRSNVAYSVSFSDNCSTATLTQTAGLTNGATFPKGVTTNTFVVTDACGNSATCSFTVTINDTEPPVITCPTNIIVNAAAGLCNKTVTYKITISDNCGTVDPTNVFSFPPSGSVFPVGTTAVTNIVVDAAGNSNICTFTVTVLDNQPPVITCPSNIIVAADNGVCFATGVNLGAPVATDNCGIVTVTTNAPAVFPLGTNTVIWTVVDSHNNTNTCAQLVIVRDTQAPAITCPGNLAFSTDPGRCSRSNGTYSVTFSDNCSATLIQTAGLTNGATFPKGVTTNRFVVTDTSGNSNSCSFTVTVSDTEPPTITCPTNRIVSADTNSCSATGVNLGAPVTSDNCAVASVTSNAPSSFPLGTNTVIWIVTDTSGNTNSCQQLVIVRDTQAPVINCPSSNIVVNAATGVCSSNVTFIITATDNCSTNISLTSFPPSGFTFPVGTTTVTNIAVDASGNSNSCTFTVTVLDKQPPAITCPASNIIVNAAAGSCSSNVAYSVTATDNCGVISSLTSVPPSGSVFPVGTTTVTNIAVDTSGNSNSCTFTVTVLDNQLPSITCPSNIVVNAAAVSCFSNVAFTVTATDNCGVITSLVSSPASGSPFPVGVTTVNNTAVDSHGNTNTCAFTVTVLDNQPPAITCPGNLAFSTDPGKCSRSNVTYSVTFSDNCSATLAQTAGLTNGATFPKGVTTNRFVVTDASGNTNTCSFTVTVTDNEPPAIICPPDFSVDANSSGGWVWPPGALGAPVVTDNCAIASVTSNAPAALPVGTNIITWIATDTSGNTNSCPQRIIVIALPPTILCAADVTVFADSSCVATGVILGLPVVTNPCGTFTLTNNAPATFPLGTNVVTWTVTNTCGKSASCQQLVIVVDGQPPAINCPSNLILSTDPGQCSRSNVTYSVTFSDNCSGATLAQTAGLPSGATFPKGVTTNRFTATDAAGNSNSCSFTVTIVDNEPPAITCPTNIIVSADTNSCSATGVNLGTPVTSDNCAVASVTSNAPASFPLGTNTVTWVVTDTSGNTNSCQQLVIVRDTQAPAITCPGNLILSTDPGHCSRSNVIYSVTFSDNCSGATLAQTAGLPVGATFSKGVTTNRFTVTDASGNSNSCSFTVTIVDTEPPFIACPADVIVPVNSNSCFATGVNLGSPVTNDNCAVAAATNNAPSVYPLGTNIVTWTASDTSGNLQICLQKVIVRDTQAPTITCPPDVTVSANFNSCFATGVSLGSPATADNCAVAATANNAPSSYPPGTNTVLWTVTDTSGNTNACTQRVIVRDNQPPAIACPGDITLATDPGRCSRSNVTFTVNFSDNCSSVTLAQTAGLSSGATFVKGVTTNRFTVTDASGNTNACSFTVTIVDNEAPVIVCPADILIAADASTCAATGVILGVPALTADNCAVAGVTSNALASYPLGTNTVLWIVTDTSGNTNTCTQRVIVRDTQPPAITCPGNLVLNTDPGRCSRSNVTYSVTFSDNCSGPTLVQTAGLASGATFVKGVTTNRFTVTDAGGNSNSCSFTVTIVDNEAPSIACPADVVVSADNNSCSATGVALGAPSPGDNCAVAGVTSNAPSSYPLGTNTVTWIVTDASGNTNFCQQKVIVRDTQAPGIICPGNVMLTTDPGRCSRSNVTYSVTITDNCSGAALAQTAGFVSGATFAKGVTTNRFTATDAAGNTNSCSFTVTVTDNEAPAIICPATLFTNTVPGGNAVTNIALGTPVTTDNCAVAAVTNNATAVLPVGTNVVTWIVADTSGNFNTCTQTVVVIRACSDDLSATALTNVMVCASYSAGFTTVAASQFSIAYTWKFKGQILPGYTNNSLLLPVVDVTNDGVYTVEVRTPCATNTRSATLTVLPLPAVNPVPYTNSAGITINTFSIATPYGSLITPQCVTNVVRNVTVELHGLTHDFPADVSVLLMSPEGRTVMLMAGVGGGDDINPGVDLLFTDNAILLPPEGTLLTNGVYHPSNYRPGLTMPAPVPGRPYSTNLSTFIGAQANGPWRLFVYDDSPGDGGAIVSWKLNIEWQTSGNLLLQNPQRLGNGSFQAEVLVAPGVTNVILCTTNLVEWTPLQTNAFSVYPGIFVDNHPPQLRYRFYRAVLQP